MSELEWLKKIQLYRKDPWEFLINCVMTQDQTDRITPIKAFPKDRLDLKLYSRIWVQENFIAIPKSRRMFMTWMNVALYTWDTMWNIGRSQAFVSKKEDDANELVKKAKFILDNIPETALPKKFIPKYEIVYNHLKFPEINSEIRGFPQGADQLRMFTFSGIFADEMGFWEQAQKVYAGSVPTLEGGGRFTGCSSPAPGFFKDLVFDRLDQERAT